MDVKALFESERDIPYRIALSQNERNDSCAGKNLRLKEALLKAGLDVRYRICYFNWSTLDLPKHLQDQIGKDEGTHLYLEVKLENEWEIVDVSWDKRLSSVLPVNEWGQKMEIAVTPTKIMSPEEGEEYLSSLTDEDASKDLEINGTFYQALNTWLEEIRT